MNIDNKSGGGDWEERIYFMDNLRAVAMFLGVVLHAAILYCYFPLFARPEPTDCPRMIYISGFMDLELIALILER